MIALQRGIMCLQIVHSLYVRVNAHLVLMLGAMLLFYGCIGESGYKQMDFSQTVDATPQQQSENEVPNLRVAVAAMVSPKETIAYYRELLDYIGRKIGRDVTLIQKKTYGEINELFPKGEIDLAFICTGPYTMGKEVFGFDARATPVIRGEPLYQSYLIVHKNSSHKNLLDLKGQVFAFTDPESNTGALVPKYWLSEFNETPDTFFRETNYTYSHDNSILAVAKGLVDGATVDGHIWEYYKQRNPFYTSMTKVIKKSKPFGSPPLVASEYLSDHLKKTISELLLTMHKDPEGRQILNELLIEQFVVPEEKWYTPVKEIYHRVTSNPKSRHETEKS